MRYFFLSTLLFFSSFPVFAQVSDSCLLVGTFSLDRLEMSQSIDSNSRVIPTIRWSLYEQSGLQDTLTIKDGFEFVRTVNFSNFYTQVSIGKFKVRQDNELLLTVAKGQLYSMPDLQIETLNNAELVIVEKFQTRWIRRKFTKYSFLKP